MKVGVIGLGPQGLRYVKTVTDHLTYEMAWGVDRAESAREKCTADYGCNTFADLAEVEDADIAVIATNADSHRVLFEAMVEKVIPTGVPDSMWVHFGLQQIQRR